MERKVELDSSKKKQEAKKPDQEVVSTSQDAHQIQITGRFKCLKKMWSGFIAALCFRKKRKYVNEQAGVNLDSTSTKNKKLTVVLDLDSTLVFSTREKCFPGQQEIKSIKYYVAIRPHCRTLLETIRPFCNIMVYSAGARKYVNHIVELLDPEKKFFDKVLNRDSCQLVNGIYLKDLRKTGYALKRTVWIDDKLESFPFQPFNGIVIKRWIGDPEDEEILKIIKLIMQLRKEKFAVLTRTENKKKAYVLVLKQKIYLFLLKKKLDLLLNMERKVELDSSKKKQEAKKPDQEVVSTSQDAHQIQITGRFKCLKKMWSGFIAALCFRKKRKYVNEQAGVNLDSTSTKNKKLTVVLDLDSTLVFSTREKCFPGQQEIKSIKYYVAIRPHCRTLLETIRPFCNIMVYSAGARKYVNHIVELLDPERKFFDKVLNRDSCQLVNGIYLKDLRKTGYALKRTVWIDDKLESFPFQPFNGIVIKRWIGDPEDEEILKIIKLIMQLRKESSFARCAYATLLRLALHRKRTHVEENSIACEIQGCCCQCIKLNDGKKNASICKQFGLSQSTVFTIWKNRSTLLDARENCVRSAKKFCLCEKTDIDEALLQWFRGKSQIRTPISGPILKIKAEQFATVLGYSE
ncbi:CTD small phosphatase-like protein 2-B [Trichinella zimbabwensis]|uniref:CTD small phosphatase-like protein 2-B n=1 Tax=Trichinella zimbabwensis TaxID=268475 RepID=A0A0V1HFI0_9BILA|nr:CTD small phosphatase-like protein 2-B [Trichinella zimbabwensis]